MADDRSEVWCDAYQGDSAPFCEQCEIGSDGDVRAAFDQYVEGCRVMPRGFSERASRAFVKREIANLLQLTNSPRWLGERLSYAITTARSEGLPDMSEAQWRALRAELVEYGERKGWAE